MWRRGKNKYGAKKTEYKGQVYDSKREAEYAGELDLQKHVKEIKRWERQVRIPLEVNGVRVGVYIADFVVTGNDGGLELHEVKGYETPLFKLKFKLCRAIWGNKYKMILVK